MDKEMRTKLMKVSAEIKLGILEGVHAAASGHPGGSLSISDILAYLYFCEMRVNPADPHWENRDRLVLSKGHTAPALYTVLALRGFIPREDIATLRQVNSYLQGHPDMKHTPGVDMSSGSLGLGISASCGMALSAKLQHKDFRVYTILGDGESEEGQVWEAAMFAAHYRLDNLCCFVDFNGLQIDGRVTDVIDPTPLDQKFEAFGWHTVSINGHDLDAIEAAVNEAKATKEVPTAIICQTIKGKGVSFMEDQAKWHGSAPNDEQYSAAIAEIKAAMASL